MEEAQQWLGLAFAAQQTPPALTLFLVEQLFVAASLATAQGRYLVAATLFGLADGAHRDLHETIGGPPRLWAAAALDRVQGELEGPTFAEAYANGQRLTLEEAWALMAG